MVVVVLGTLGVRGGIGLVLGVRGGGVVCCWVHGGGVGLVVVVMVWWC